MGVACRSSVASEAAASLKSPPQTGTLSSAWGLSQVTYCLCSLGEGSCESCNFPGACEPVRLQQLLYPPPGGSGSVQRGCLLYSHHDSYSYNPIPSGGLPWLLGATGYLTLSIQDSFMAGSASLVASWFWLFPALSFKRKQPFFLRLRIAVLTSLVDSLAITAPDWDSVNLLISHSIF